MQRINGPTVWKRKRKEFQFNLVPSHESYGQVTIKVNQQSSHIKVQRVSIYSNSKPMKIIEKLVQFSS